MRVVIADDNLKMCMGIKKIITDKFPHFTVDGTFEDGESLMEYLDNHIPDLLITDICMPGFDGLEACRKLREKSASTNIILITGYKNFEYAKEAIRYKVHDLLVKPFSSDQLIEAIISAVNGFSSDNTASAEPDTPQHYIVLETKAFVEKHYSDPSLSRSLIAEHLSVNASYLSDVFKSETKIGLSEYITQVRIHNAKKLLSDSSISIQEVAKSVGCNSLQYFYQLFKKETGITPAEYQKRKRL
ncbi:MAG: response regulator [Tyzzerella sp.]|nr:response regulator [Tyzzerella sp.]